MRGFSLFSGRLLHFHVVQNKGKHHFGVALELSFQYGPVVKLQLQILLSLYDQPYGIWQFSRNILTSFFKTLLLGHIGMLISRYVMV